MVSIQKPREKRVLKHSGKLLQENLTSLIPFNR